jgi:group II intron reverse transcriptase/maturase
MQISHLQYVVDVDIKGFFDNVNHRKLMRQMWTLGIKDTKLLQIIKQMLKAPIQMPDETIEYPKKGTPQGGILSPLLANIVLNELDWWIASQWEKQYKKMKKPLKAQYNKKGDRNLGHEYRALRKTNLKEMYIVRYADDFKIFCKSKEDALKIENAVKQWLKHRLKLEVSKEKTGITNLKKKYCEFLGFKLKLRKKGKKQVVNAQMCDKAVEKTIEKLKEQVKQIQKPKDSAELYQRINKYNSMVIGIQNYYGIANKVTLNFCKIQYEINILTENRLNTKKTGSFGNEFLKKRYGKSKQVRWIRGKPIMPIGFYKSRIPMSKKRKINQYTPEGRAEIYKSPDINIGIMRYIMENPIADKSVEYNDNRISLYVGQKGKCAVTGNELQIGNMQCHHIKPKHLGGDDKYKNLIFLDKNVHILLHATEINTILKYLKILKLNAKQLRKLNKLRVSAGLEEIKQEQTILSQCINNEL